MPFHEVSRCRRGFSTGIAWYLRLRVHSENRGAEDVWAGEVPGPCVRGRWGCKRTGLRSCMNVNAMLSCALRCCIFPFHPSYPNDITACHCIYPAALDFAIRSVCPISTATYIYVYMLHAALARGHQREVHLEQCALGTKRLVAYTKLGLQKSQRLPGEFALYPKLLRVGLRTWPLSIRVSGSTHFRPPTTPSTTRRLGQVLLQPIFLTPRQPAEKVPQSPRR